MKYQRSPVVGALLLLFFIRGRIALAWTTRLEKLVVIGFVGGRVSHTNAIHQEVQLAAHLREKYPAALDVEFSRTTPDLSPTRRF